jgi:ketosteroid isomerase-like protein
MALDEGVTARLQHLLDRHEIEDLLTAYCRALDRRDTALLRSIYHPDATEKHGAFDGAVSDFIDHYVPPLWQSTSVGFHAISNVRLEIDESAAAGETYVLVVTRSEGDDGSGADRLMAARYLDRFERRDGGPWLIAHRTVVFDWVGAVEHDAVPTFPLPAAYLRGAHGADDLSSTFLVTAP